jgi:hypothetical protein
LRLRSRLFAALPLTAARDDHTFTVRKTKSASGDVTEFGDQDQPEQWMIRLGAPGWLLDNLRKGK